MLHITFFTYDRNVIADCFLAMDSDVLVCDLKRILLTSFDTFSKIDVNIDTEETFFLYDSSSLSCQYDDFISRLMREISKKTSIPFCIYSYSVIAD